MKKHEPGSIYQRFLWTSAAMLFVCVIIIGILVVGVDASMDTINVVMGIMIGIWTLMEAYMFVYGVIDMRRSNKRQ